jgi:hypothetical protein
MESYATYALQKINWRNFVLEESFLLYEDNIIGQNSE